MIYLDNAATSFPKPPEVARRVFECLSEWGGSPGRGSYKMSLRASEAIYACRESLASLFDLSDPLRVIFTPGDTYSINLVLRGILRPGDHVLCSNLEHNAVFRPLEELVETRGISYDLFVAYDPTRPLREDEICKDLLSKIRPNTKLVICTHASNICSVTLPIEKIGKLCRARGILFCVDAAQSAGRIPISMENMCIDALCLPGHKGLFGPAGCGALLLGEGCLPNPLVEGGSGYRSLDAKMPEEPPERYEAGTLPTPAIIGLRAGVDFVRRTGVEAIGKRERELTERLKERLRYLPGIKIYAPEEEGSILLFSSDRYPASAIGDALDRFGFCLRTGFHCAALAHRTLRTPKEGALRASPGFFNAAWEVDALADRLAVILKDGI